MVSAKTPTTTPRKRETQDTIEKLLSQAAHKFRNESDIHHGLKKLRRLILVNGLARDNPAEEINMRRIVWKLLLSVHHISAQEYISVVTLGRSRVYDKVRNDTFRTLATDKEFNERVGEERLIRMLNAFAWKSLNASGQTRFTYVQGMNVLAAPFLYTMPELDAFYAFSSFIEKSCPLYVQPTLEGVHHGLRLLDRCLKCVDPKLYAHLRGKNLSAELYAFPCEACRRLRIQLTFSRINLFCLHSSVVSSLVPLGLSSRVWCSFEYPLRHCATTAHSRQDSFPSKPNATVTYISTITSVSCDCVVGVVSTATTRASVRSRRKTSVGCTCWHHSRRARRGQYCDGCVNTDLMMYI